MSRLETGPVQMPDDWPGVFIRGDNAAYFAGILKGLLSRPDFLEGEVILRAGLDGLANTLRSCHVSQHPEPQMIQFLEGDDAAEKG